MKAASVQKKARHFQGLPIREARGDILVKPTQFDIDKATPHDPENCVYAIAVKRMLQTKRVFVYTHIAYVESLDDQGVQIMERYMVRNSAKHAMDHYDKTGEMVPAGFVLHKPPPSYTLDAKARYGKKWVKANRDLVLEYAKRNYEKRKKQRKAPVARQLNGTWRDGTGCVRFLGTREGIIKTKKG